MSGNGNEWYVAERARALARMHLTRRDDLVIVQAGKESGLDYLVSLARDSEKPSARQFGVALRAARSPPVEERLNEALRPEMRSLLRAGEFPYPVCLFYFTMEDDGGYYAWVAEPVRTEDGKPRLRMHSSASCQKLDRAALDEIASRVGAWYDALFSTIVVSA
jgi:hypothetical protein